MNVSCPYHRGQQPECLLVDVTDALGNEERVHTNRTDQGTSLVVVEPPLQTNAVCYGDRIVVHHLGEHYVPSMVIPGEYYSAFGRIGNRGSALHAFNKLQASGFVVAWDQQRFGVAWRKTQPELGDMLLEMHAAGKIALDRRFLERFANLLNARNTSSDSGTNT